MTNHQKKKRNVLIGNAMAVALFTSLWLLAGYHALDWLLDNWAASPGVVWGVIAACAVLGAAAIFIAFVANETLDSYHTYREEMSRD